MALNLSDVMMRKSKRIVYGTTDGCLMWQPGPIGFYDKLVGVIWRALDFTISLNRSVSPKQADTSEMRFYGECSPNSNTYI